MTVRMYYDRPVITDSRLTNNRPDDVVLNKVFLIDVAAAHQEKQAKYANLAIEIKQM